MQFRFAIDVCYWDGGRSRRTRQQSLLSTFIWGGSGRFSMALLLLFTGLLTADVDAVRCFCDRRNCDDALICSGLKCLVGFKSDVRLDQMCATEDSSDDSSSAASLAPSSCAADWGGWREVCACDQDFCNTFAFLRHEMSRRQHLFEIDSSGGRRRKEPVDAHGRPLNPIVDDDDLGRGPDPPHYQSNSLVVLLVVVPLAVGTSAVCLVFINYHCKMC